MTILNIPGIGEYNFFYLEIDEIPDDEEARLRVMISLSETSLPDAKVSIKVNGAEPEHSLSTGAFQFNFMQDGKDDGGPQKDKVEFQLGECESVDTIEVMLIADGHISFPADHNVTEDEKVNINEETGFYEFTANCN